MNKNKILIVLIAFLGLSFAFSSCVKQNFDVPPSNCDSLRNIKPTLTIDSLKKLYDGDTVLIKGNVTIEGNVISTDQFGNFYKKIVIQDSTGGIEIEINDSYMFTKYPLGQKILVKCDSLILGDYNGTKELGMDFVSGKIVRLDADSEDIYLQKICEVKPVEPKLVSIAEAKNDSLLNTLIKIKNVEFSDADLNTTWADGINQSTVNHNLVDTNANSLIVRTSGFASFAKDSLPKGSGYIIGIISKYGTDYQLYVRNTNDAVMDSLRFK